MSIALSMHLQVLSWSVVLAVLVTLIVGGSIRRIRFRLGRALRKVLERVATGPRERLRTGATAVTATRTPGRQR